MNKKKWTSLLMILALLLTLLPAPELSAMAEGDTSSDKDNGMKISKTATPNDDGIYTITLEAYATGSQVTTTVQKDIPTDIILVLDQSGSMDFDFETVKEDTFVSYGFQKNSENYELRHNNTAYNAKKNLYYKLDDGGYAQVSVTRPSYKVINDYVEYANASNYDCNHSSDTLYAKTDEGYKTVEVSVNQNNYPYTYTYTYTLNDETVVTRTSSYISGNPPYTIYKFQEVTVYTYEYSYTKDGITTIIGTQSEGDDTVFGIEFYQYVKSGSSVKRLSALKSAVTSFANAVAKKAAGADGDITTTDDNINHRIAVVGFASKSGDGNNTELLSISGRNSGNVGVAYNNISEQNLKDVMQSMDTSDGKSMVYAAINELTANGATEIDLGMDMAERILGANPVRGEKRNRVVIVFTDGSPTDSDGFKKSVASDAIAKAKSIKDGGTTVYSIGIFSGADASSAGTEPSGNLGQNSSQLNAACNWFMQKVSSNNGTPRTPSYYLSAGDAASLNNIFQQISDQIQTGGSSTTLNSSTVIKDIISPSFVLPEGTTANDITLETYACTGMSNGEYTWSKNADAMGATATITEADIAEEPKKLDQVNVTGFDFSENWCGTETVDDKVTYRGNKLVIKIKVKPRPGFFGGNGVTTNTFAGIYENADAKDPTFTFVKPTVDVPLATVVVEAPEANVYLGAHLNETVTEADVLKNGATVKIGDSTLDFSQENYGLKPWQNEYVNIEASASTSGSFENMTEDTDYTVTVKMTPKTGSGKSKGEATGRIHVFKPELTFKDSEVKYMVDTVTNPDYFNNTGNNKVSEIWKNGDRTDTSDGVTMLTNKPTLALTYTPKEGALRASDGLVISPDDIPVAVAVGINGNNVTQYTTFVHQACNPACGWTTPAVKGNPAFLLHVKDVYADLTITKRGANETADPGQSFLFTVTGPDNYSTEVIIVGNGSVTLKNLKIGTYTVTENTGWSWRYTPTNNGQKITLEANGNNEVTINNTRNKDQWLDGNVYADNKFTGAAATTD